MPAVSASGVFKSSPPFQARYVACGEPAAEARVVQDLARVATGVDSEVGDALRGLVLVGAFARGEGGIVERDGEPHAAEPGYQLLALFKTRAERCQPMLDTMAATWTRLLSSRVTMRALSLRDLAQPPATRFWYHAGRRQLVTLVGDPTLVSAIPRFEARELIPEAPAFVLCESLAVLACASLDPLASEHEAIAAMHDAVLACGDAMLLRRGQYADSLRARAEAVDASCASAAMRSGYREGIDFAARPDLWRPSATDGQTWLASTRRWLAGWYLDGEAERTGSQRDLVGYVRHRGALCGPEPAAGERSLFAELTRVLALRRTQFATWLPPLERLLRASVALAFAPHAPQARQLAAQLLHLPGDADPVADHALLRRLRALAVATLAGRIDRPFTRFDAVR